MKRDLRIFRELTVILVLAMFLSMAAILVSTTQPAYAETSSEKDYVFETVPVENIEIAVDGGLTEIQPREEFYLSYEINPWYTTTSEIYFDVIPNAAAVVSEVSEVQLNDGRAYGTAIIAVSADAVVGSRFTVVAGADGIGSNSIEMTVAKIPVKNIALSLQESDDKLHIGKTRTVECEFFPSYASDQDVRYELSGSGMKYIEDFDETSGTIKAKKDVALIDVNSTVTITAYSIDNPNAFDSVTLTLYMPTTVVEISADTPLGCFNSQGNALAVASSFAGDTVSLSAKVNGVDSTGLNYVIVKGQEYIEDGYVHSDGTFVLRSNSKWSENMKKPHPEIKIRAAYSDGFDEITVSVYVPVERISFVSPVINNVENFRSYDMRAEAFPKYATLLADNAEPIYYSLNGIDSAIASVDNNGLLSLPRSLTSKGSVINFSANLTNAWEGVDVQPLTQDLTIMPVYAEGFNSISIIKNGATVDGVEVKALPSDKLTVEVVYTVDNVTDVNVTLSQDSDMIFTSGNSIDVRELNDMHENNPLIEITVNYDHGGNVFAETCYLSIYVPALSAEISNAKFHRYTELDLKELIKINVHGYATNDAITWGTPTVISGNEDIIPYCDNGRLRISPQANAGTIVRVPYKTYDSETWQYKDFTVAAFDKDSFDFEYGKISSIKDNREYTVAASAPQLEEGQSVEMYLKYNKVGGKIQYGLTYSIEVSPNATLVYKSGDTNSDVFVLGAKSGQSGNNNYITYKIAIYDGTETYYIYTDGVSVSESPVQLKGPKMAIFKRISGTLGVSNDSIEIGGSFNLTGWDWSFTFNQYDLKWELSEGTMRGNVLASGPNNGFVLEIKAKQIYNGKEIDYSSKIAFSSIIYKFEDSYSNIVIAKKVYRKTGSCIYLEGEICHKENYIQTGWSKEGSKDKDYYLGAMISSSDDLTLYAYWFQIGVVIHIGEDADIDNKAGEEERELDENQNINYHTRKYGVNFNFQNLLQFGYTKVLIKVEALLERTVHEGEYAKLWLDLNNKCVYTKDRFEPTSTCSWENGFSVVIDILSLKENSQVRLGFYTYDDGIKGKFTWKFYEAKITLTAIK